MKKHTIAVVALAGLLALTACGGTTTNKSDSDASDSSTSNTEIPSPWEDVDTLDDATEKAGFDVVVPDSVDGYTKRKIQVVEDETIQVFYRTDAEDGAEVLIRKSSNSGDASGDYNDYAETSEADVDGHTVTLRGNDGTVSLATWSDGTYSYSIGAYDGGAMSTDAMLALVAQVG